MSPFSFLFCSGPRLSSGSCPSAQQGQPHGEQGELAVCAREGLQSSMWVVATGKDYFQLNLQPYTIPLLCIIGVAVINQGRGSSPKIKD